MVSHATMMTTVVVTSAEWTPIMALMNCDYMSIWNVAGGWAGQESAQVLLSADTDDDLAQKPLYSGNVEVVIAPSNPLVMGPRAGRSGFRFTKDDVVFYAKSAGADTALIVTCVR